MGVGSSRLLSKQRGLSLWWDVCEVEVGGFVGKTGSWLV